MDLFARAWKGQASLAEAFWLIHFLFGFILNVLIAIILYFAMPAASHNQLPNLVTAITFPYTLFATVCVWRCAHNSAFIWRFLAKLIVILAVLGSIISIVELIMGQPTTL